jgi:hypothetical protein
VWFGMEILKSVYFPNFIGEVLLDLFLGCMVTLAVLTKPILLLPFVVMVVIADIHFEWMQFCRQRKNERPVRPPTPFYPQHIIEEPLPVYAFIHNQ